MKNWKSLPTKEILTKQKNGTNTKMQTLKQIHAFQV